MKFNSAWMLTLAALRAGLLDASFAAPGASTIASVTSVYDVAATITGGTGEFRLKFVG